MEKLKSEIMEILDKFDIKVEKVEQLDIDYQSYHLQVDSISVLALTYIEQECNAWVAVRAIGGKIVLNVIKTPCG